MVDVGCTCVGEIMHTVRHETPSGTYSATVSLKENIMFVRHFGSLNKSSYLIHVHALSSGRTCYLGVHCYLVARMCIITY